MNYYICYKYVCLASVSSFSASSPSSLPLVQVTKTNKISVFNQENNYSQSVSFVVSLLRTNPSTVEECAGATSTNDTDGKTVEEYNV